MAAAVFPLTLEGQAAAFSVSMPRTISYTVDGLVVYTDEDYIEPSVLAKITALEQAHPITHRNLRELSLVVAQIAGIITGTAIEDNPAVKELLEFEAKVQALRNTNV